MALFRRAWLKTIAVAECVSPSTPVHVRDSMPSPVTTFSNGSETQKHAKAILRE